MHRSHETNKSIQQLHSLSPSRQETAAAATATTLADYLVRIRSKKHTHRPKAMGGQAKDGFDPKRQRVYSLKRRSSNSYSNSYSTNEPLRTKRAKTAAERQSPRQSSRQHSLVVRLSKLSGCTLQPHFTKQKTEQSSPQLSQDESHSDCIQYQFEFPSHLLEEQIGDGFQRILKPNPSASCCSIISQITQDTSLDEHSYDYCDEDENDNGSSDDESLEFQNNNKRVHSPARSRETTNTRSEEVQEGAKLLLDLFSMQ